MATTTNFGWETPDDTDLVKDGALAIRTLGNSIDTSLVDLKGGTTGQVLSKTSNTDMDFTWVTSDDANAIQNAIVDAKGDLIAASAADTPARLAVGNNGETLVADSSASTGLRWQQSISSGRNFLLNGSYDFWQRGTSGTANGASAGTGYNADRWANYASGTAITVSRQATSDTTNLPFIQYCARVQRNSGQTSTSAVHHVTSLESSQITPLIGRAVTLSFYARKGANFSATSDVLAVEAYTGTGTDQNIFSYTGAQTFVNSSATLTTTWQRFTFTGTTSSSGTEIGLIFKYTPTGTAGANDYFEITGVQLEVGSVATTFSRAGGTLAGEFQAACRYYWRITKNDGIVGHMYKYLSGDGMGFIELPVPMRVTPTSMDILNVQFQQTNLTNNAIVGPTLNTGYSTNKIGAFTFGQTGLANGTQGYAALTSSGYIGFSAEL